VITDIIFEPKVYVNGQTPDKTDPNHDNFKSTLTSYVIATVFLIMVAFMQFAVSKNEFANYYINLSKQSTL
jgi:hypothetical protein